MNVGNKGKSLLFLKNNGFNVPKFELLGKEFFNKFLKSINALDNVQMIKIKNAWLHEEFSTIRNLILNTPISKEIESEIYSVVKNLKFPISIRSSASVEDGNVNSGAGVFKTSLNVQKENVIQEVRNVIASLYEDKCLILLTEQDFHPDTYYMGLIFQEMVDAKISGVAFSADPLTGNKTEVILEMTKGLGENLVSGIGDTTGLILPKLGEIENKIKAEYNFVIQLRNEVIKAEELNDFSVDIEWAYSNKELFILQCRPITTIDKKPEIDNIMEFSMSSLNSETYPYLGYLQRRYPKWLKKARFFDYCEKRNIKTNKWKFMVFNDNNFDNIDFDSFFKDYDSKYVSYHLNSQTPSYSTIKDMPGKINDFFNMFKDNLYCVSIREFLPNEMSAISSVNSDGSVQIECISGKMSNLNTGISTPTKYVIDNSGNIIERYISVQEIWQFDSECINIKPSGIKREVILKESLINEIYRITKDMHMSFGECTVEWWIWKDILYAVDMSLLKTPGNGKDLTIISNGKSKGKIYKLPDINQNILNNLNMFSAISVCDTDFDVNKVNILKELKNIFEEWSNEGEIILHSDKPYLFLAPFKEYISGFIFNNASNLCHLSLILRESGIPALSLNNKQINFEYGQYIELDTERGGIINKQ